MLNSSIPSYNSSCENELKKVQYANRYKIYDIEIHPVSETISSAMQFVLLPCQICILLVTLVPNCGMLCLCRA